MRLGVRVPPVAQIFCSVAHSILVRFRSYGHPMLGAQQIGSVYKRIDGICLIIPDLLGT